jgi:integrase
MRKEQLDLDNRMVWIPDSKTPNGVAEVPLTEIAAEAFRSQLSVSGASPYLFSIDENPDLCAGQVFHTFASATSARRTPLGSERAEWPTSGSRSCSDRAMRRCSRSTRR